MMYETRKGAELEAKGNRKDLGGKWGIREVMHKGRHDRYEQKYYQPYRIGKAPMRYFLMDVFNHRSHRGKFKNNFSSLAHAKRMAETTHGNLDWTSQDNLNADQSITKWYFGKKDFEVVSEIRHTTQKGITPLKDEYILKNPIGKTATSIRPVNGWTAIKYHDTDVVSFSNDKIVVLNSGTWKTPTTKRRMNETSDEFNLGFRVYAKKGDWYIDTPYDGTIEFFDGVRFQGQRASNPKRKRKVAKKKRSAKQLANDKRLGRMAKARAKKKRGGRRKKVARKKTTRRVVRRKTKRNPKRTSLKKSHLWLAFKCTNVVRYLGLNNSGRVGWFTSKSAALLFRTRGHASAQVEKIRRREKGTSAMYGAAPENTTAAKIRQHCDYASGK